MSLRDNENNLIFSRSADIMTELNGDVPKWLKGADSKSARRRKACGGSNPSISANRKTTPQGGFLIGSDEGFEPIKCRCPVDICLPPVSTAATHLFSFPSGNENVIQIPPSPPIRKPPRRVVFLLVPMRDLNLSNADVRWTSACRRSRRRQHIYFHFLQEMKMQIKSLHLRQKSTAKAVLFSSKKSFQGFVNYTSCVKYGYNM